MTTILREKVPRLRFRGFSGEWEEKKLGSIGVAVNGLTYSPKDIAREGLLVLRSSNIKSGQVNLVDSIYVNLQLDNKYLSRPGDILICVRNGSQRLIGKNAVIPNNIPKATHGAFMTLFRSSQNKFITHVFQLPRFYKQVHADLGARINSINTGNLLKYKFFVPQTDEQEKIAEFLTTVDKKIAGLQKKKELLEKYKKGIMQKIFSQDLRFKDKSGKDFPAWQEKQGNQVFKSVSERNNGRVLPILAITQDKGAVPRDEINYDISVTDASVKNYKVVRKGDFIISLRSFQGGIEYSNYDGICSPAYVVLRSSTTIDERFYKYFLKTKNYIQRLTKKLEGIRDGKMISYKYFSDVPLPYPTLKEQHKMAEFLNSLDDKIKLEESKLEKAKQFKKALLQQMFA